MAGNSNLQLPGTLYGKVSVLYDGGCPLCSKEIAHYKRLDRRKRVNWVDIDHDSTVLDAIGVSKRSAMKHLHVIDSTGQIVKGAYAFAVVWRELPLYRCIAKVVRFPGVLYTLDKAYNIFAEKRFNRRARCNKYFCS